MSLFFNKLANYYDQFMFQNRLYKTDDISFFFRNKKELEVLDLAGGTGVNSDALSEMGHEITVADLSIQMLQEKEKMKRKGNSICCNAENLPFRDGSFDAILLTDALHHFKMADDVLCEVRRMLKPNGFILVQEFYPNRFKTRCLNFFEKVCGENADYRTPGELTELTARHGFRGQIIELDKYQYFYHGGIS